MSLLRYFTPKTSLPTSGSTPSLLKEALAEANKRVSSLTREANDAGPVPKCAKKNYSTYSAEDRSKIGRYAAEHGPTKASQQFTRVLRVLTGSLEHWTPCLKSQNLS